MEDKDGKTILHHSCLNYISEEEKEFILFLVDKGIDINKIDGEGKTALFYILEKYDHKDLYFFPCSENYESLIKYFIEHGANINIGDRNWNTPLIYSCKAKHLNEFKSIIKIFIESGADINKANKEGKTALFYLMENLIMNNYNIEDYESFIKYLIDHGANFLKITKNFNNPFNILSKCKKLCIILMNNLLSHSRDINKQDIKEKIKSTSLKEEELEELENYIINEDYDERVYKKRRIE